MHVLYLLLKCKHEYQLQTKSVLHKKITKKEQIFFKETQALEVLKICIWVQKSINIDIFLVNISSVVVEARHG